MKELKIFLEEASANDYLVTYAIMCDKKMSDFLLETIDAGTLGQSKMKYLKDLTTHNKVDKLMLCWENVQKLSYKEIHEGMLIDINGQLFISLGVGDGLDSDEFEDKILEKHTSFKTDMKENGYVLSKDNFGPNMEPAKDIKKLTEKDWE